ncbi:MAG: S-layer homology domain-containing protein [Clostridia bacterium]|nr:S-layer homology domain-containing protein [Clostridia bacterium]
MKKALSFTLSMIMLLSVFTGLSFEAVASTNGYTQSSAVDYAKSLVGKKWDVDNSSYDCVDIIKIYFKTVGGMNYLDQGNAGVYATTATLPSGWTRQYMSQGYTPQPGDVAAWAAGAYMWNYQLGWGHVGIVTSVSGNNITLVDQDTNEQRAAAYNTYRASDVTCYIHPDFPSGNNPISTLDSVTAGKGYIRVSGWTFDKDDVTKSIDVHVYIGGPAGSSGAECYGFTANISRRDVDNVYHVGEFHGFDEVIYTSKSGTQDIYVYAINIGSGTSNPEIGHKTVNIAKDTQSPQITDVAVSNVSSKGYTVTCTVKDDVHINRVQFPTWTLKNDQDDIISNWPTNAKASGTASGSTYTYYVKASDHNNETGTYRTHIYAYDGADNYSCYGIDVNVHDHSYTWVTDRAATCTANGSKHQECSKCGEIINKGTTIFSLGHSWSSPTYTWSSDNKTCTATRVCARDSSHKETQTVNTTSQILRQPTMTQTGTAKYTAVFSNSAFSTQTKSVSLPKTYDGFPDVKEGSWYYDAVKYCAQSGYMSGYQNENFGPNDNLKRQDFVVILANIAKADLSKYQNTESKLKDVKKGAYYAAAVNWAVDKNIIAGYDNGNFGVNDNITREQIAVILYRYKNEPAVGSITATLSKFSDYKSTSAFAVPAMAWTVQQGAISGNDDGTLAPTKSASRAQIASIIMRMDQKGMFK